MKLFKALILLLAVHTSLQAHLLHSLWPKPKVERSQTASIVDALDRHKFALSVSLNVSLIALVAHLLHTKIAMQAEAQEIGALLRKCLEHMPKVVNEDTHSN